MLLAEPPTAPIPLDAPVPMPHPKEATAAAPPDGDKETPDGDQRGSRRLPNEPAILAPFSSDYDNDYSNTIDNI